MDVKEVLSALLKQSSLIVLLKMCKFKFISTDCNVTYYIHSLAISLDEMKCTVKLEDHLLTPIRENAIMLANYSCVLWLK